MKHDCILRNVAQGEHNGAASCAGIADTKYGPRYILQMEIHPTLLEQMVANYEFALDNIKLLSFYFYTRHAGDALAEMQKVTAEVKQDGE